MNAPLQRLGVSAVGEAIYLELVTGARWSPHELATRLDVSAEEADQAVVELVDLGLVELTNDGAAAFPPRPALEALAEQRARESSLARESAATLAEVWNAHVEAPSYVEVLGTTSAAQQASTRLNDEATTEVRALSIGPQRAVNVEPSVADGCLEAMGRGVVFRVVYGAEVLKHPLAMRAVQRCIDAGEDARVFPDVPLNLVIGERYAHLSTPALGPERLHALIVHRSGLYDGLVGVFDSYWRMGVPVSSSIGVEEGDLEASADGRRLLTYLSAGLTDESIARELGVSERTVARRVARLQEILGAQSRFQLGVQATRRGWL